MNLTKLVVSTAAAVLSTASLTSGAGIALADNPGPWPNPPCPGRWVEELLQIPVRAEPNPGCISHL